MKDLNDYTISDSEVASAKIEGRPNPMVSDTVSENQAKFDALPKAVAAKMNAGFAACAENFTAVSDLISDCDGAQTEALLKHASDDARHVPLHEGSAAYKILGLKEDEGKLKPDWKDYSEMVAERDKVISDARLEFSETISAADAAFEADRTEFNAQMNELKAETEQAKTDAEDAALSAVSSVTAIVKESEKSIKSTADAVEKYAAETLIPPADYSADNGKCLKASYTETETAETVISLSDHMQEASAAGGWDSDTSGDFVFALDTASAPGSVYCDEPTDIPGASVLLFGGTHPNYSRIGTGTGVTVGSSFTADELSAHADICVSGNGRLVVHNTVVNSGHTVSEVTFIAVRLHPALPGANVSDYVPGTYNSGSDEIAVYFKGDLKNTAVFLADGTAVTVGETAVWYCLDDGVSTDELPLTVSKIVSPDTLSEGSADVLEKSRNMGWFDAKGYTEKFSVFPVTVKSTERAQLYDDGGQILKAKELTVNFLSTPSGAVPFYVSMGDFFTVPADTERIYINFGKGEAYKKSSADSKLMRYTDLDWIADTFAEYPGCFVYIKLQDETAADVLYTYTALSTVQYAVSQKTDKADGKGLSSNDFTDALKEKLESGDVIGTVSESALDDLKESGLYKVVSGDYHAGYIFVQNGNFISQYYLKGVYSIQSLTEAIAQGVPIWFRYSVNNGEWMAWKTLASVATEKASTAEENAKSYADTKGEEALAGAKSYADEKDGETLTGAKSYADSKDSETLESAKSYADKVGASEVTARVDFPTELYKLPGATGGISKIVFYANGYPEIESGNPLTISIYNGETLLSGFSAPVGFGGDDYLIFDPFGNVAIDWFKNGNQYQSYSDEEFLNNMAQATEIVCYDYFAADVTYANVTYTASLSQKVDNEIKRAKAGEAEVLATAAEYADTKISTAEDNVKSYAKKTFAGALKGEKTGEIIRIDDVSPLDSDLDVTVSSKNLLPFPYVNGTVTQNGVTVTVSDDGSITMNGTAASDVMIVIANNLYLEKGSYMLSGMPQIELSGKNNGGTLFLFEKSNEKFHLDYSAGTIVNIEHSGYVSVNIKIYAGTSVENAVIKPQLERGSSSTAYTKPVSDLSSVTVKKYGRNLLPFPYNQTTKTLAGVTWTVAEDGKITASGTATDYTHIMLYSGAPIAKSGAFSLGFIGSASNAAYEINFTDASGTIIGKKTLILSSSGGTVLFDMDEYPTCEKMTIVLKRNNNGAVTVSGYPQLEAGAFSSVREAYISPATYTVNEDGEAQSISANEGVTTLVPSAAGVTLNAAYNRDVNAAFEELQNAIISLGGSF